MLRRLLSALKFFGPSRDKPVRRGPPFRMPPPCPASVPCVNETGTFVDEIVLTDEECREIERPFDSDIQVSMAADSITCMYEGPEIELPPKKFEIAVALRRKLGRPLERDDLESIIQANGGDDGHA